MKKYILTGFVVLLLCVLTWEITGYNLFRDAPKTNVTKHELSETGEPFSNEELPHRSPADQHPSKVQNSSGTHPFSQWQQMKVIEIRNMAEDRRLRSDVKHVLLSDFATATGEAVRCEFDHDEQIYTIDIGERKFQYIVGTDVGREGHRFFPMRDGVTYEADQVIVCSEFIEYGLGYRIEEVQGEIDQRYLRLAEKGEPFASEVQAYAKADELVKQWSVDQRLERMVNLGSPIVGATVTPKSSQWPGAPRPYRNGHHEGLDVYSNTSGIVVNKNTDILSMDEGIVLRADHAYIEMHNDNRKALLNEAYQRSTTPEYILDRVRGRSVWIQHTNGIIGRYVHLHEIADEVEVGKSVAKGQVIAKAGNSGTSYGAEGNDEGVHLHLDILIDGQLFWEGLSSEQTVTILKTIFAR